jgi:Xaa-Pro aminopeptidase
MFLTNEPGYYEEGSLGIRIENVMEVIELPMEHGTHGPFLGFRPVTMIPLERSLISVELLREEEISWINSYHRTIRDLLSPNLEGEDLAWLQEATMPIE